MLHLPPKLELLVFQTWQNRLPNSDPSITTDYRDLFGSHETLFEGMMSEQHYYIALMGACHDFITNRGLDLYAEDLAEQPNPVIVADAVNRLVTAMCALYGWRGEPITPATGPFPLGMRVNYNDGRYWMGEVCEVVDYTYVRAAEELFGEIWTHGLEIGEVAYKLKGSDQVEFWCNHRGVLPEGK